MNKFALISLVLLGFTPSSFADNDKSEVFEFSKRPTSLDFVSQQQASQKLNELKAVSTPELIKAQADYYQKMYQALVKSGFDKQEALKIVIAIASSDK